MQFSFPKFKVLLKCTFVLSFFSFSVLSYPDESDTQGQSLYQQCAVCHGLEGEGISQLNTPAIAGQYSWYLTRQLNNFSNGYRGTHQKDSLGKQMLLAVKPLVMEKDVELLANYISALPVKASNSSSNEADKTVSTTVLKNGSRYYQAKCGACHGGQGQGNKSFNAPKLNNLSQSYLLRQMNNFTQGIRGTAKEDKFGRQMAMMAKTTSGSELDDIISYLVTVSSNETK